MRRLAYLAAAGLLLAAGATPAVCGSKEAASAVLASYISAWDRADARAIAGEFAPGGDFVNPTGFYARGPAQIEAFYRSAFERGYAGSEGRFEVKAVREIAPDVVAVDGVWSIEGAHGADGRVLPTERGLATGILTRGAQGWRVALLREQSSATDLEIPPRSH